MAFSSVYCVWWGGFTPQVETWLFTVPIFTSFLTLTESSIVKLNRDHLSAKSKGLEWSNKTMDASCWGTSSFEFSIDVTSQVVFVWLGYLRILNPLKRWLHSTIQYIEGHFKTFHFIPIANSHANLQTASGESSFSVTPIMQLQLLYRLSQSM